MPPPVDPSSPPRADAARGSSAGRSCVRSSFVRPIPGLLRTSPAAAAAGAVAAALLVASGLWATGGGTGKLPTQDGQRGAAEAADAGRGSPADGPGHWFCGEPADRATGGVGSGTEAGAAAADVPGTEDSRRGAAGTGDSRRRRRAARGPGGNRDLYCEPLFPTPRGDDARGLVQLAPAESPFGAPLTPKGKFRYRVSLRLEGLPEPESLGPYRTYVAWAASPVLRPMVRLGAVGNGTRELRTVSLNKFLVLVTAEPRPGVEERRGPVVLRAQSPSLRLQPHDLPYGFMRGGGGEGAAPRPDTAVGRGAAPGTGGGGRPPLPVPGAGVDANAARPAGHPGAVSRWSPPPMHPRVQMVPLLRPLRPPARPFLPEADGEAPMARPRTVARLEDGDTLRLTARRVRRRVGGRTFLMYGFNGQYPGPLIRVPRGAEVVVRFRNRIGLPSTVHWHGVRIRNRFDGVPDVTQEPVAPGDSFTYRIHFRDAGIYWYHPHVREDVQQDLGLYGNMLVEPGRPPRAASGARAPSEGGPRLPDPEPEGLREDPGEGDYTYGGYFGPVNREQVLTLDDLLLRNGRPVPYGRGDATHAMMGRFGNTFLVNGEPRYRLTVRKGEVVRFYLTNVANTRTFNLSFGDLPVKVVASDLSRFEREVRSRNVVLAPAERYVVEVRFDEPGTVPLLNRVQAIDHVYGNFFTEVDTLGRVRVLPEEPGEEHGEAFRRLRSNPGVRAQVERYRRAAEGPVDHRLHLTVEAGALPFPVEPLMRKDSVYFHPLEAAGTMPRMNWLSTTRQVRWILRDPETGRENMEIDWSFEAGELSKIRIRNLRHSFHAMQHPIHIHGQRFLVLARNGEPAENLVWKDTTIIPVGTTATILLELSNLGEWMLHCHIAEHLNSGMRMTFDVDG